MAKISTELGRQRVEDIGELLPDADRGGGEHDLWVSGSLPSWPE
ncbi:hypothetical protein [Streptomyces lydicus]|nr:hypothetical protein [Streptomyces lydicus]MCZ1012211.1 hypothetical protein [Streptomyces lydicus]